MKEIKEIIKEYNLNCTVKEFESNKKIQNKVYWDYVSSNQKLSEEFIEKHQDKVVWYYISKCQQLSEEFIEKHQDKVNWYYISIYQKLSEEFIDRFQAKVNWLNISRYQQLSEEFIDRFQDKVNWNYVFAYQQLSEEFIEKHKNKLDVCIQSKKHKEKSYKQKLEEVTDYAKKHNLKIDKKYLYAFREHDDCGRGCFNKTITYKKGKYYQDWHCDMDKDSKNSFGLGIWPKGNTQVKVKIEDWGVAVEENNGKARVWGFEII